MPLHPDPAALLAEVDDRLAVALPEAVCELDHDDPWQLLIVTILSAQARDSVINEIRPALFERWPTPAELAAASQEEVELVVKRSGYYRNKAKAIRTCAQAIVERHGGEVPRTHEELVALPGASHKTANLVLGIAFGVASGIVVDTHVARVSARLGVVKAGKKPDKVEAVLTKLVPRERWIDISHRLILHGRHLCKSKGPDCENCAINELCDAREREPSGSWRERAEREGQLFAVRGDRSAIAWPSSGAPSSAKARPKPAAAEVVGFASEPSISFSAAPTPKEEEDDF
ncbi:Ultraviolet N-glycosylase/AP lyase [Enhygromyxa salina]|uniref:Endonuclease III n=1 Tax=Enhygromyxa salina TaxID=215803 RepID=A0A2S9XKV0_9BACT|nr:endonuclease III [Enhygromyxa salina]PRP93370.1 Ultraviolet N-glycosylase/AP lyase [Enhygromyxa salina]